MRIALFLLLLIAGNHSTFSQNNQILAIQNGKFYNGTTKITLKDFVEKMRTNNEAYKIAREAKDTLPIAYIFSFSGGVMIGWPIGTALAGEVPNWKLSWGGLGAIVIGLVIESSANKKLKTAMDIYNSQSKTSSHLKMGLNRNGFGLSYIF